MSCVLSCKPGEAANLFSYTGKKKRVEKPTTFPCCLSSPAHPLFQLEVSFPSSRIPPNGCEQIISLGVCPGQNHSGFGVG